MSNPDRPTLPAGRRSAPPRGSSPVERARLGAPSPFTPADLKRADEELLHVHFRAS